MLERDYKFYLSFENNFCRDYVTEKLFNILQLQVTSGFPSLTSCCVAFWFWSLPVLVTSCSPPLLVHPVPSSPL